MAITARRWFHEPMMWLALGIPLATVVAGLWTLRLAAGGGGSDVAAEPVRRTAQVQTTDLAADQAAAGLGLAAVLRLADDGIWLESSSLPAGQPLVLWLRHPVAAAQDRQLHLAASGAHWRSGERIDGGHAWNLLLAPPDQAWRLVGRYTPGATRVVLEPALSTP